MRHDPHVYGHVLATILAARPEQIARLLADVRAIDAKTNISLEGRHGKA